jgi:tetratricopeptide (TPR) repeat protein
MEGEPEYGFWHLLVRDVAYGQIPRAQRTTRHLRAADWLESKAGKRVEDLAEVLAYHTGEALDLAQATGDKGHIGEITPRARRYALLAGERAAGLDADKAMQLLDRALQLTADDDPERAMVLTRWARIARDVGQGREALTAVTEAVALARAHGDLETLAAALLGLGQTEIQVGERGTLGRLEEAVALLEPLPPGQPLVEALAHLASARMMAGAYREAIETADRALALASQLGLPIPARPLSARGSSRCSLGDAGGLTDGREALARHIAAGTGGPAAIVYNNLGIDTFLFDGPLAALAVFDEGEVFAAERGLILGVNVIRTSRVSCLLLAGRLDDAVRAADQVLPALEESGELLSQCAAVAFKTLALVEQGYTDTETSERTLAELRRMGLLEYLVDGVAAAVHSRVAVGDARGALQLVRELLDRDELGDSIEYAFLLCGFVRSALAAGNSKVAAQLISRVEPNLPIRKHALETTAALLAEARGDYGEAADRFADAVARWDGFGAGLERAYALLGKCRCLAALGDPAADATLREARAVFAEMGARPRVEECDTLLRSVSALSS